MADFPIYHGITLSANAYIENFNVEMLAADPSPVAAGRVWYNTTDRVYKQSTLDATGAVVVRSFATVEDLTAAVNTLTAAINAEATRATAAEGVLTSDLAAEVTRATAAEGVLTSNLTSEVSRATAAEQSLGLRIDALGSAFNYVSAVLGGETQAAALDLSALAQKDAGDYYKVTQSGWFVLGSGTPFHANLNDGIVFDLSGSVDIIDNTNSEVNGTAGFIAVTGSTETGFVVDVDAQFKGRVSDLESDLAQEITDRTTADSALDTRVTTVEGQVNGKIGVLTNLTTTEKGTLVGAINELDSDLAAMSSISASALATLQTNIDAEAQARINADSAIRSDYNARRKTFSSSAPATQHTFTHGLNDQFVDVTLWVQRANGEWRNDVVSMKMSADGNSLDVYPTSASNIRLVVTSTSAL